MTVSPGCRTVRSARKPTMLEGFWVESAMEAKSFSELPLNPPRPSPAVQETVDRDKKPISVSIHGRHDPIIVPRAVVVVESMQPCSG